MYLDEEYTENAIMPNAYDLDELRVDALRLPKTLGNPPIQVQAFHNAIFDSHFGGLGNTLLSHSLHTLGCASYTQFLGYGALLHFSQNPLIVRGVELRADETVKNGWSIERQGEDGKDEEIKIEALEEDFKRFKIDRHFHTMDTYCGYFGGGLLYVDVFGQDPKKPLTYTKGGFPKGSLLGFKPLEPILVTPGYYNSENPLKQDYYKPKFWLVQGIQTHSDRLLHFKNNEISYILKPAYNFFGISTTQKVLDDVAHFTSSREAVARLLKKFSLWVFKHDRRVTNNAVAKRKVDERIQHFAKNRDNDGVIGIDKDEDILNISANLSGTADILSQFKTFVASAFETPDVKFWGISPGGLNSTGDSDFKNFYDYIESNQREIYEDNLNAVLKIIQLNRYGKIDPTIVIRFKPLSEENEQQVATIRKTTMETAIGYLGAGVIDQDEIRKNLIEDKNSGFSNIEAKKPNTGLSEQDEEILRNFFQR